MQSQAAPKTLLTELPKSEIMVVGVFHFDVPGRDLFNPSVADLDGDRRQKEIVAMVEALAEFKPTKVCLEAKLGTSAQQDNYEAFLKGDYKLTLDERNQMGFRLAKLLGHKKVFSVDQPAGLDFDSIMKTAQERGQTGYVQSLMDQTGVYLQKAFDPKRLEGLTMGEFLAEMNTKEADLFSHSMYLKLMMVGDGAEYPGASMLASWYERNLKISTNLFRLIEKPGERILLIIGAGHAKIIRDVIEDMPNVSSVSPVPYLLNASGL